jgi:hypothetical protein
LLLTLKRNAGRVPNGISLISSELRVTSLNARYSGGGRLSAIWCFAAKQKKYTA